MTSRIVLLIAALCLTCRTLSMDTGCPPALLLVTVIMMTGMLAGPFSVMNASSACSQQQ
jgi:hypothetical protein